MDNTGWYRVSEDLALKSGATVKIYRVVFETSDYALSNELVKWCEQAMDIKNAERRERWLK